MSDDAIPAPSAEWCLKMARLEEGQEIGAGMPDHPLRAPLSGSDERAREVVLEQALRNIAEGNLGPAPWQANYARIRQVAAEALAASRPTDAGAGDFLAAIHAATPTGQWIAVQHHPNGDWSVACDALDIRKKAVEVASGFVSADYPDERDIKIAEAGIRAALATDATSTVALATPKPPVDEAITGERLFRAFMSGDTNTLTGTALPTDWPVMKPSVQKAWNDLARVLTGDGAGA